MIADQLTRTDSGYAGNGPTDQNTLYAKWMEERYRRVRVEIKLDVAEIALREQEMIIPTLLAREQFTSRPTSQSRLTPDASSTDDTSSSRCHICQGGSHTLMICSNNHAKPGRTKFCKNTVCQRCFLREGWEWDVAEMDEDWQCPHCLDKCPARASCRRKTFKPSRVATWESDSEPDVADEEDAENEDACGICKKGGKLICCDGCPSSFHFKCVDLDERNLPDNEWYCSVCVSIQAVVATNPPWRTSPVVLSLFDGIGACFVALRRLGVIPKAYFSCEIDPSACSVLDSYPPAHGRVHQLGDVRELKPLQDLKDWVRAGKPGIDLLIGGSPCQDLSRLGKGNGLIEGEQSSLFFEYVRILRECKPRWFLLENVIMSPEYRQHIEKELGVRGVYLDAADVSPGHRRRMYWTNIPIRKVPERMIDRPMKAQDIILDDARFEAQKAYCITKGNMSPHLADHRFNVLWYANGRRRTFHPVEVERIMGFPDFYTEAVTSRSKRWGHLGNSFSVYAIAHILGSVFRGNAPAPDMQLQWRRETSQTLNRDRPLQLDCAEKLTQEPAPVVVHREPSPHLSIGEREKYRRVLRRIENSSYSDAAPIEIPGGTSMPGLKIPDEHHRYVVFVDPMDKAVVKREGWWPAILVPRAEYDETMPKAGRSELIVRYFEDRSYSTCRKSSLRLFGQASEPFQTFAQNIRGFCNRKGVAKALKFLEHNQKGDDGIRWHYWNEARRAPFMPKSEGAENARPQHIVMDDDKKPRDLAELRKLIDDKSRYTNVEDLETDLWEIINDRVKDLPPEDREEIVEHVKEELADNSETWLKEGSTVFVIPEKFKNTKRDKHKHSKRVDALWWPAMVVPQEELTDDIPVKASYHGQYVVRYFEDCSYSAVSSRVLAPLDADDASGSLAMLKEKFGEDEVNNHAPIRRALRYFETGVVSETFMWRKWGESGLYRVTDNRKSLKRKRIEAALNGSPATNETSPSGETDPSPANEDVGDGLRAKRAMAERSVPSESCLPSMEETPAPPHGYKRCVNCNTGKTPCWRNGPDGPQTLCNQCALDLYIKTVPRVPTTEYSKMCFDECQDKSKNNLAYRYHHTRRVIPFETWDKYNCAKDGMTGLDGQGQEEL